MKMFKINKNVILILTKILIKASNRKDQETFSKKWVIIIKMALKISLSKSLRYLMEPF